MSGLLSLFFYPILVATFLAATCSLLGVFVLTQRVVFIGATLAEVAACGVALALLFDLPPILLSILLAVPVALLLSLPYHSTILPKDSFLGMIFLASSAFSILIVSKSAAELQQIKSILYGNILFASAGDFVLVVCLILPLLVFFLMFLRPILFTFLDRDAAQIAGVRVFFWEKIYFVALALVVATCSKIVGVLLSFGYLILGPALGLLIGKSLWSVFFVSCIFGVSMTLGGMYVSYYGDLPTSQTIVALGVFCISLFAISKQIFQRIRGVK